MNIVKADDVFLHYKEYGKSSGLPIVFINSLGTDYRLWERVIGELATEFRLIGYDKRGHGLSSSGKKEYSIELHANDTLCLMDALDIQEAVICGISVGGMIAQHIAASYPERVNKLILCNTALRIGSREFWQQRIAEIDSNGIEFVSDAIISRWFSKNFKDQSTDELHGWSNMLLKTSKIGYLGTCDAIMRTNMIDQTKTIKCSTLCIGADEDIATPPGELEKIASIIASTQVKIMEGAGHLPCAEKPSQFAQHIKTFLRE